MPARVARVPSIGALPSSPPPSADVLVLLEQHRREWTLWVREDVLSADAAACLEAVLDALAPPGDEPQMAAPHATSRTDGGAPDAGRAPAPVQDAGPPEQPTR